jgi:hypothetical protein
VISSNQARDVARTQVRDPAWQADPHFARWTTATIGDPVLVRTLAREPSYWLVPIEMQEHVAGFVRVSRDGRVAAIGTYDRHPGETGTRRLVTHIDAAAAATQAAHHVRSTTGETASSPVYVHDGPPGREAWLIEVTEHGRPTRWIFVSPGGVYERPAGTHRDLAIE